ncbi:hypothetical protein I6F14_33100 [Bradyrhizobium sp. IC3069]|uniref:hypothetical protein n=1 Tax=unclassified Bradyrhizobium TaxID=2631580 RepID=UPI001CD2F461|nr:MULTISPECIES: hypothetical protein [unclassified Bradyrhizobium]MCA1365109.1 hypothetical protein [Bradyrhizobium sp. IC4059]MCA1436185.1 hypothetical protein [Bradyrhizobium sp. BRP20]MCA1522774.1 hypothetical protein [Bradyrhizobium sp. IC3069]
MQHLVEPAALAEPEQLFAWDGARGRARLRRLCPYKTLPVEEQRGVVDSLKNLEHIVLRWDKLIDA